MLSLLARNLHFFIGVFIHFIIAADSHLFEKILKRKNICHLRFHDLRHTNATLMLKQNIPAKVASERLGHSSIGITMDLYTHVLKDLHHEAAEKINSILFNDGKEKENE